VAIKLALAGDTMLGRQVGEALASRPPRSLIADEVIEVAREADLLVLNLECCISERGEPWPDPRKPFFFRAPPAATETLTALGANCVTLANNHALDYGEEALLDTLRHLDAAGIAWVGAGPNLDRARAPQVVEADGFRLAVIGVSDHPEDFAADADRPGIAFAPLRRGRVPDWLLEATAGEADADAVLVTPHWGPNMTPSPVRHVRAAAPRLLDAGATLVAGHSAHVFQGVAGNVLYDLGDFIDDYAVDARLRNDLGLLFLVSLDERGPARLEAVPLELEYCHTRLATGEEADWVRRRFTDACADLGTEVREEAGRLVAALR
jgi:poly-gamma-glutamate capsule biosynthesis protein CapA/YwtB (metallophosphatase superfamily)